MLAVIHTTERNETKKERYHFGPQESPLVKTPNIYPGQKKSSILAASCSSYLRRICLSTLSVDVPFETSDTSEMLRGSVFSTLASSSNLFGGAPRLSVHKRNARPHHYRSGKPVKELRCEQGPGGEDDRVRTISDALYVAFGTSATRVVQSLELLASGREYKRDHPTKGRQEAESFMYGLRADPWHDVHDGRFAWLETLEKEYETIRDELTSALNNPDLESLGNSIWSKAADADAVAYGPNWRTLVLQDRCTWDDTNTTLFPKTTRLVREASSPSVEVFFARQPPGTGIKPHTDFTNFILTSHVGLDVPENECWFDVGGEKHWWKNGKACVADTSFIHSTDNFSKSKDRYVLIIRFWHPDLSELERSAVQFLFDVLGDSSEEGIRYATLRAEERRKGLI